MGSSKSGLYSNPVREGEIFDPFVVLDSMLMSDEDVVVLSDDSIVVPVNESLKEPVVLSSDSEESVTENARKKKGKKVIESESDYDEKTDGDSVTSEDEEENDEDASMVDDDEDESVSQCSKTTPRRRRIASASSLSSIEVSPFQSPKRTRSAVKRKRVYIEGESSDDQNELSFKKPSKKKPNRIVSSDEEDESSEDDENPKKRKGRRILTREELAKETIDAENAERERRERLEKRQREFNGIQFDDACEGLKKLKTIILDDDKSNKEPNPVQVHASLVKITLPHQADGIKFLYDSVVESLAMFRKDNRGSGAILAYSMGLGKTFITVSFVHTILTHSELREEISKVLIVVPKNVILNWKNEFSKWLVSGGRYLDDFNVTELDTIRDDEDRLYFLKKWHSSKKPGVMLIGYDLFRILTQSEDDKPKKKPTKKEPKPKKLTSKQKRFQKLQVDFRKYLQDPGPDLVICDEGHKLKNCESILSKTMMKIRTKRRVCLTGTPLQNNLMEYHVMVNFVKENLLGSKTEFANRFANPINRGRTKDADNADVAFMKRRAYVLNNTLKGIVQRKEISVLKDELPEKQEFVIFVKLTPVQCQLYDFFVNKAITSGLAQRKRLLADYYQLARIWTHPYNLIAHAREMERKKVLNDDLDGFIVNDEDGSTSSSSSNSDLDENAPQKTGLRKSNRLAGNDVDDRPPTPLDAGGWWDELDVIHEEDHFKIELSNKLILLVDIIKRCEAIGDKILVFSQSLESLKLIKEYLEHLDETNQWFADGHECLAAQGESWHWMQGRDYMIIDGSVGSMDREDIQSTFNNKKQLRARLLLISTKAGSLGTNMVAANRVVIFDSHWNPALDTQSLFRIYRIGQTKPSYIYRFVAQGTMEEKIYNRQVTKESVSLRVVDDYQIQRHFYESDLEDLYTLNVESVKTQPPPRDKLLAELILNNPDAIIKYENHDSLFENQDDEKLTAEECQRAWEDYEREKKGLAVDRNNGFDELIDRKLVIQDPIYLTAVIRFRDETCAFRLAYIKVAIEFLLRMIPDAARTVKEYGTDMGKIMEISNDGNEALKKAIQFFVMHIPVFSTFGGQPASVVLSQMLQSQQWLLVPSQN